MSQEENKKAKSIFSIYWELYGGLDALVKSKYLYFAIFMTLVCFPFWDVEQDGVRAWTSAAVEIIPSLMAFSLGGMAILLAFSNEKFMKAVQQKGKPTSLYMKATATFFHFILIQTGALFTVFLSQAYANDFWSGLGFFLMSYGLAVAVATAAILLQMAQIFNAAGSIADKDDPS